MKKEFDYEKHIDAFRAERDALKAALEQIASNPEGWFISDAVDCARGGLNAAKAARHSVVFEMA